MIEGHAGALAESLTMYLLLAGACAGWGRIVLRRWRIAGAARAADPLLPWAGWAAILLLLQAVHIAVPLTAPWVLAVLLPGIAVSIRCFAAASRERSLRAPSVGTVAAWVLLAALAVLIAERSMLRPTIFDAGLYYLSAMRWINEYPLVPGLGNLHGRLAFNQSNFVWAAALSLHPWLGHGRSIANAFLLLLASVTLVRFIAVAGPDRGARIPVAPYRITALLAVPALLLPLLSLEAVTAPAPDTVVLLLQLVLCVALVRELAAWARADLFDETPLATLVLLAATAITVKLSALAFAAVVIGICVLRAGFGGGRRSVVRVALPAALVLAVWSLRGYMLSGVPLYPAAVGRIPFDWAIPVERIEDEARWIYSWARAPGVHWSAVLGHEDWFAPWLERLRTNSLVVHPIVSAAVLMALAAPLAIAGCGHRPRDLLLWLAPLPAAAAIVFWFLTAPDPRFALGAFWCLGIAAGAVFLDHMPKFGSRAIYGGVVLAVFVALNEPLLGRVIDSGFVLRIRSTLGWAALPTPALERRTTASGLELWIARDDQRCWDAPLPCAPRYDAALEQRRPGDAGAGFRIASGTAP